MRTALSPLRLLTLALAVALAVIVAFWTMRLLAPRPAIAPADVVVESGEATDTAAAARLFGGPAVATAAAAVASNVQVAGVVATGNRAVAVLSIDGQPGRAYGVGAALPDGSRVVRVQAGAVWLERNGARLELPAPSRPSLAVLTAGRQPSASGAPASTPGAATATPGAAPAFPPSAMPSPAVPPSLPAPALPPPAMAPAPPAVVPAPAVAPSPAPGTAPILPADAFPARAGGTAASPLPPTSPPVR